MSSSSYHYFIFFFFLHALLLFLVTFTRLLIRSYNSYLALECDRLRRVSQKEGYADTGILTYVYVYLYVYTYTYVYIYIYVVSSITARPRSLIFMFINYNNLFSLLSFFVKLLLLLFSSSHFAFFLSFFVSSSHYLCHLKRHQTGDYSAIHYWIPLKYVNSTYIHIKLKVNRFRFFLSLFFKTLIF